MSNHKIVIGKDLVASETTTVTILTECATITIEVKPRECAKKKQTTARQLLDENGSPTEMDKRFCKEITTVYGDPPHLAPFIVKFREIMTDGEWNFKFDEHGVLRTIKDMNGKEYDRCKNDPAVGGDLDDPCMRFAHWHPLSSSDSTDERHFDGIFLFYVYEAKSRSDGVIISGRQEDDMELDELLPFDSAFARFAPFLLN